MNKINDLNKNTSSSIELTNGNVDTNLNVSEDKEKTSDVVALIHVLKSSLGTGILAIAFAFKSSGLLVGLFGTPIIGFLSTHCTYIMVSCSQALCVKLDKTKLGYTETVEAAFLHCAGKQYRNYAHAVKVSVEIFMFVTYYGTVTTYIILSSKSLEEIIEHRFSPNLNKRLYILVVGMAVYFVGIVKSMKYQAPFSALANLFLLIGISIILHFLWTDVPRLESREAFGTIQKFPVFFSTVLFGMEGIGTILPVENSMKNPKHFLGCPGVLVIAMTVVVSFFTVVGYFGYLKYGEDVAPSITSNLPNTWVAETVKGLTGLALFFSYGLQLTAAMDVVWKKTESRFPPSKKDLAYFIMRSTLIVGTVLFAEAVPELDKVVPLIGSFGFSMCGFFYPAVVNSLLIWDEGYGFLKWKLVKNAFLALLALAGLVTGVINFVHDIMND